MQGRAGFFFAKVYYCFAEN